MSPYCERNLLPDGREAAMRPAQGQIRHGRWGVMSTVARWERIMDGLVCGLNSSLLWLSKTYGGDCGGFPGEVAFRDRWTQGRRKIGMNRFPSGTAGDFPAAFQAELAPTCPSCSLPMVQATGYFHCPQCRFAICENSTAAVERRAFDQAGRSLSGLGLPLWRIGNAFRLR